MWPQLTLREEKKKAIDRSAWLLLLHCFPGSLPEQRLSSCWPQGLPSKQHEGRGGRGEQGDRELNAAVKWQWLPARIQNRSLRAKGCWDSSSPSPSPTPSSGNTCKRRAGHEFQRIMTVLWELHPMSEAELVFEILCDKVFPKWSKKVQFGNKALFVLHQHCSKSLTPLPESTEPMWQHWTLPKYHEAHDMAEYSYMFSRTVTFIITLEKT